MSVSYGGDSIVFADGSVNASGFIGHRNRIINGAMVFDQRNAGASITPTHGSYTLDRWECFNNPSGKYSVQQNAGSVTPPAGFANYFGVTSLSAYTVTGGNSYTINQKIEGFNFADMAWGTASAAPITLSFWVRSSLTGTFGGALRNSADTRSYPFTYTISTANTFEYKTVTIAGDTSGTWIGATNGVGLRLFIGLGVGPTYSGTAGAWASAEYLSATGATSVVGTNGATFYITGVQLERGSTASSFEYRPHGTELALCQRYYWQSTSKPNASQFYEASGAIISGTQARINFNLPTAMRTQPAVAVNPVYNTGSGWQINLTGIDNYALSEAPSILAVDGAASGGGNHISVLFTTATTMSSANYGRAVVAYTPTGTATNNFQFSAEL
jgi:hypothetical protein